MPDYAPNWTPRAKFKYSTLGEEHTITWRLARGADIGDGSGIAGKFAAFLNAMAPVIAEDFTILAVSIAETDSDIFLPAAVPAWDGGGLDTSSAASSQAAYYAQFIGRTTTGGRAAFYLYGYGNNPVTVASDRDFRVLATENTYVAAGLTALDELAPALAGNDGAAAVWYPYANVKYNDYWVHQLR